MEPPTDANLRLAILRLQRAITALEETRMPVLAAIQGGCVGGGVDLITAADCRYATADAWFSIHEINIGITADLGTLQRLPGLIPEGVAREYAYTGRRLGARRCKPCLDLDALPRPARCAAGPLRSRRRARRLRSAGPPADASRKAVTRGKGPASPPATPAPP